MPTPNIDPSNMDSYREDGSLKDQGFLGPMQTPEGQTATEKSIGVEIDGKEVLIPSLVPTLTREEVAAVLGGDMPPTAVSKAVEFAKARISSGLDPFFHTGEQTPTSPSVKPEEEFGREEIMGGILGHNTVKNPTPEQEAEKQRGSEKWMKDNEWLFRTATDKMSHPVRTAAEIASKLLPKGKKTAPSDKNVSLGKDGNITIPPFHEGETFPEGERKHQLHEVRTQEDFEKLPFGATFRRPGSTQIFTKAPPEPIMTRAEDGMQVPGAPAGDTEPIMAEGGEFIVSNDMMDQNPDLREELHAIHQETLADLELPEGGDDYHFRRGGQKRGGLFRRGMRSIGHGIGKVGRSISKGGGTLFRGFTDFDPRSHGKFEGGKKWRGQISKPNLFPNFNKNPWQYAANNPNAKTVLLEGPPNMIGQRVQLPDGRWGIVGDSKGKGYGGVGVFRMGDYDNHGNFTGEGGNSGPQWSNSDWHDVFGNNYDPTMEPPSGEPIFQPNNPEGGKFINNPAPNDENPVGDNENYIDYDPNGGLKDDESWQDMSRQERKAFKAEHGGSGMMSSWEDFYNQFNTGGGGQGGGYRGNPSAPAWWGGRFNMRTGSTSLSNPYGGWGDIGDDTNNIGEGTVLSSVGTDMGMGLARSGEGPLSYFEKFGGENTNAESSGASDSRRRSLGMGSPRQMFRFNSGSGAGPLKYPAPALTNAYSPSWQRFVNSRTSGGPFNYGQRNKGQPPRNGQNWWTGGAPLTGTTYPQGYGSIGPAPAILPQGFQAGQGWGGPGYGQSKGQKYKFGSITGN